MPELQKQVVLPKKENQSLQEEVEELKLKIASMSEMLYMFRKSINSRARSREQQNDDGILNSDGIPTNTCYVGFSKVSEYPFILTVGNDGKYKVGDIMFPSLSASAEHVSGVRRSGWTFWKLLDGRTLKEAYKQK